MLGSILSNFGRRCPSPMPLAFGYIKFTLSKVYPKAEVLKLSLRLPSRLLFIYLEPEIVQNVTY